MDGRWYGGNCVSRFYFMFRNRCRQSAEITFEMYLHSVVVCRSNKDYWFGLYKKDEASGNADPGVTTYWLDGNPSTFRKWYASNYQEPNEDVRCVRYTKDGFKDRNCGNKYYFTCKMKAGQFQIAELYT